MENNNRVSFDYEESEDVMNLDDFVPAEERNSNGDEDIILNSDEYQGNVMNDEAPLNLSAVDDDYKVKCLSNAFLRCESKIMLESSKTVIKFSYRGEFFKGVVMQQFNNHKDEYIFLVQRADKNGKVKSSEPKVMKKFKISEISLL